MRKEKKYAIVASDGESEELTEMEANMKKPGRKILYGAGMLAMSLSLTACDRLFERNGAV